MPKTIWTEKKIRDGFIKFFQENGRLPKAHEVDGVAYLPSSRLIQKKFNGLETLRTKLGFTDVHFGKGIYRSDIAHKVNAKGSNCERTLEHLLHIHFGEVFVHSEKKLSNTKVRVDFYVYSPDGNFAIDIFHSDTLRTLQSNVNIKAKKYFHHNSKIYLVSANKDISQSQLDMYVQGKINVLPEHIQLITYDNFITLINVMKPYKNPIH